MGPSIEEALGLTDVPKFMGWAAVEGDPGQPGSDMETLLTHLHSTLTCILALLPRLVSTSGVVWCRVGCLMGLSQTVSS
eukprot:4088634-Amphidinium_carterae.1